MGESFHNENASETSEEEGDLQSSFWIGLGLLVIDGRTDYFAALALSVTMIFRARVGEWLSGMMRRTDEVLSPAQEVSIPLAFALHYPTRSKMD